MGVMPCAKEGCDNILCDYYSPTFGYLCSECLNELVDVLSTSPNDMSLDGVRKFIDTPKEATYNYKELARGFVEGLYDRR